MIVEDGTGLANADSYIGIDYADDYFSTRNVAEWANLPNKEALLIKATDFIEVAYFSKWRGERLTLNQALAFPRDSGGVPEKLKKAVCELALKASSGELMSDIERLTKKEKVGSIEVEYADNASAVTKYAYVASLLKPLLKSEYGSAMLKVDRC
ncbi:MAG: hypothetical protein LUC34_04330 [Campylobacter sp.]|nr:hypothetical protein [Campylobacter sp.]